MQPTIHLERKAGYGQNKSLIYVPNVLWVAFSIPSGSLPCRQVVILLRVLLPYRNHTDQYF
jgi:hypothetical protein